MRYFTSNSPIQNLLRSYVSALVLLTIATAPVYGDIAIVTNPNSPISELSPRQITKIFMGKLRLLPGTTSEVVTYDLENSNNTKDNFYRQLLGMTPSKLARYRASYLFGGKGRLPISAETEKELIQKLTTNDHAIGYIPHASINDRLKVIYLLKLNPLTTEETETDSITQTFNDN